MGYLILQMLVLLVLAAALGVLIGWLAFRWRRCVVTDDQWAQIERERNDLRTEATNADARHERTRAIHDRLVEERAHLVTELARLRSDHRPGTAAAGHDAPAPDELRALREAAARVPLLEAELGRLIADQS